MGAEKSSVSEKKIGKASAKGRKQLAITTTDSPGF